MPIKITMTWFLCLDKDKRKHWMWVIKGNTECGWSGKNNQSHSGHHLANFALEGWQNQIRKRYQIMGKIEQRVKWDFTRSVQK